MRGSEIVDKYVLKWIPYCFSRDILLVKRVWKRRNGAKLERGKLNKRRGRPDENHTLEMVTE